MCKYSRLFRNFVNWRDGKTYKFTIDILLVATIWVVFPYKQWIIRTSLRAMVWMIFGPQNKWIDRIWILRYYRTTEQLLSDGIPETMEEMKQEIASRTNILDLILTSKWVHDMGRSGRIVVEENLKLQAAREARYGKYSESVPAVDSSRFASVPASSSSAQPYLSAKSGNGNDVEGWYKDISAEKKNWSKVPGQRLHGSIIHQPSNFADSVPTDILL